ncbi:hypothetical protein AAKU64_004347 [Undibacterium sp. GrIS 1.8]
MEYECRVNNVPESALETAINGALKVYQSQPVVLCCSLNQATRER